MFTVPELRAIVNDHRKTYARQALAEADVGKQNDLARARDAFEQLDDWLAEQEAPNGQHVSMASALGDFELVEGQGADALSERSGDAPRPYWSTDDLSDIPEDLIEELGLNKPNPPIDRNLVSIIEDAGIALKVNQVVLGYLRRFGERLPREKVARKLYRLTTARGRRVLMIPKGMRGRYGLAEWGDAGRRVH